MFQIQRDTTDPLGAHPRREVAYGITCLPPEAAGPARLLALNRDRWAIENKLHRVRDVTFDEDPCRIRKRAGAHVMAWLRNLVISLPRPPGAGNIAEGLRISPGISGTPSARSAPPARSSPSRPLRTAGGRRHRSGSLKNPRSRAS